MALPTFVLGSKWSFVRPAVLRNSGVLGMADVVAHWMAQGAWPPEAPRRLDRSFNGMCAWTRRYLDEIEDARRRFDTHAAGGAAR
ncbi:hypothetical protein [Streptomyces zagrosensis]|uniref:Uncharacterized protein n=1 Tax=Streptomyces zagrosensis TaxID=1042984 RepID=A0A7W9Q9Z9_9ACTN|nr:hypothetical protein [Streptomyces zagrosensis]MBB5935908.1 hypothetical protein [Streptomyces zagrosensis]